jgi:predicted peroxiredoxin
VNLTGKKLGLLVSTAPETPSFHHALGLAKAALHDRLDVYFYCIDEGVKGVEDDRLQVLKSGGLKLFACAYGARKFGVDLSDAAIFSGLAALDDLVCSTDRFLWFN